MNVRIWFLLLVVATAYMLAQVTGCSSVSTSTTEPDVTVVATPAPVIGKIAQLPWANLYWDSYVNDAVIANIETFKTATDWPMFCPKFKLLSGENQVYVVAYLVSMMAKKESGWNPNSQYQEPKPPAGPGTLSAGLLQISVSDSVYGGPCKGLNIKSIFEPKVNLSCSVQIMAKLIAKDKVMSNSANRGMARYWSVMRPLKSGSPRPSFEFIKAQVNSLGVCK